MSGADDRKSGTRIRLDRVRIDQELTFAEAAAELGRKRDPDGRKLRNLVQQREQKRRQRITVGEGREVKVTMSALYRAFPELRPARIDYLAASLRELLVEVDARVESVVHKVLTDERVIARIVQLEKRANAAEGYLRTLAEIERNSSKPARNRPTG